MKLLRILSCATNRVIRRRYATNILSGKTVRIGCASGFWGDTAVAAPQLIYGGNVDFLVFDYLSEITMSLLTAAKTKVPELGFAPDFVQVAIAPFIKDIKSKGIRVISNAGGVNPLSCAAALKKVAHANDIQLKIAVVTGDELMPKKEELAKAGVVDMTSGKPFPQTIHSMNAYLGAGPIARALDLGADIVITGRCVDSAIVLGPLLHTFKWPRDDYDLLAAGSLAGHIVECGAQATGGIFTDWDKIEGWDNIGFPIVECGSNGSFVVSKPAKTGGLVSKPVVSEQLVYEIGDPTSYMLPDVTCDFSNVNITELPGHDGGAVFVSGARGTAPSDSYKVSATYASGYRATGVACVGGPRAAEKARKTAKAIIKRTSKMIKALGMEDYTAVNIQVLGSEETYGTHATPGPGPREAVLWLAVTHKQKKALEVFAREIAPAGTGMAPGMTGLAGGRPKASPVLKLFSYLYPKKDTKIDIHMDGDHVESYECPDTSYSVSPSKYTDSWTHIPNLAKGSHSYRLEELAYTRSGDKGNMCNIGVIARHPKLLPYLHNALTTDAIEKYFAHVFDDQTSGVPNVQRYELPGLDAFNFVLNNALGGGGIASLRSDPQGKAFGQMLLDFEIHDMPSIEELTN
ncbi:unnamed protein product [Owenia fusiformis]|uniref:Uncharacterized protein n=1 Tax=Owenia fusiformis TaxID=6347 RepID=A0A8J1TG16_OWEFU|nr:unnamed protein product [Owenia fusiformis]